MYRIPLLAQGQTVQHLHDALISTTVLIGCSCKSRTCSAQGMHGQCTACIAKQTAHGVGRSETLMIMILASPMCWRHDTMAKVGGRGVVGQTRSVLPVLPTIGVAVN